MVIPLRNFISALSGTIRSMTCQTARRGIPAVLCSTLLFLSSGVFLSSRASAAALESEQCMPLTRVAPGALPTLSIDDYRTKNLKALGSDDRRYRVATLAITRQNVFPNAGAWLTQLANRLHWRTREAAIRAALPFRAGDTVSVAELKETERILRRKPFFYDALLLPTERCGAELALQLVVRDVWTLAPNLGASRSGGDNKFNVGISDINLLGSGKGLSINYQEDRDRRGVALEFRDPNVRNSRWALRVTAADNDDGEQFVVDLARPFFALDTRWSTGMRLERFVREKDLEFLGEDLFVLDAETNFGELFLARSNGRQNGWIDRRFVGYRYFREAVRFPSGFPDASRQRRRFGYPFVAWQRQQDRFEKTTNVNRVGITEDIELGWRLRADLGWSTGAFAGGDDALLTSGAISHRRFVGDRGLLSSSIDWNGRFNLDQSRTESFVTQARLSYLLRQRERWRFFTAARYRQTRNLLPDDQLTLGGDVGLRGYSARYQPGDRSYLLTFEQRYHSPLTLFGVVRTGFAAFLDVGQAWFHDEPPSYFPPREGDHFETLANVGLGLRFESIRTRRDRIVHIDFARALVDGPGTDSFEVTVTAKRSF
ncbi:MAG: hypothetical protein AAF648_13420 [Pseudomonadota bacterium]